MSVTALITPQEISLDDLWRRGNPRHGARLIFTGAVRNLNHGRPVRAVGYDAFEPLAEKILLEIGEEIARRYPVDVHVVHRVGTLSVGELSVAISVSAPHRHQAYAASREIIERLKVQVPVWKKEYYVDGESRWLRGHALCGENAVHSPTAISDEGVHHAEKH